jgi:hypothetical protein
MERTIPTHHEKIRKAHVEDIDTRAAMEKINSLLSDLYTLTNEEVVHLMKDLIPEYHTTNGKFKGKKATV